MREPFPNDNGDSEAKSLTTAKYQSDETAVPSNERITLLVRLLARLAAKETTDRQSGTNPDNSPTPCFGPHAIGNEGRRSK